MRFYTEFFLLKGNRAKYPYVDADEPTKPQMKKLVFLSHMRSKFSFRRICNFLTFMIHSTNINDRKKFQNVEVFIFCQRSQIIDRTEISAICDHVMTSFCVKNSENQSFFTKKAVSFDLGVPQQHHLSRQHLGGHVA